jgi:fatty-acid desaturase
MFIVATIVLCVGYGVHEGQHFAHGDGLFALARAAAAAVGTVALAIYFHKLWTHRRVEAH